MWGWICRQERKKLLYSWRKFIIETQKVLSSGLSEKTLELSVPKVFAYKRLHRLSICDVDLLRTQTKLMIPGLDYVYSLKHMMFFHFRLQLWVAHFLLTGVVLQLLKHYFVFLFMLPFLVPLLVTHLSEEHFCNCSCMCIAEKIIQQGAFWYS